MTAARRERAALVETLRAAGPNAPTLCAGWDARDLAAHLVIREYRPDAAPGILIPLFAGHTAAVQRSVTESSSWTELLDKVAAGPPIYSPFKALDAVANVAELFIHHEDVRRAQPDWHPRVLDPALAAGLARTLPLMARRTLSKSPAAITLRDNAGKVFLRSGKGPEVTVIGMPAELLLFAVGRKAVVEFEGDPAAVETVRASHKAL